MHYSEYNHGELLRNKKTAEKPKYIQLPKPVTGRRWKKCIFLLQLLYTFSYMSPSVWMRC